MFSNSMSSLGSANRSLHNLPHSDGEFSSTSVINTMESFFNEVNKMESTVLVPCRLIGLKIEGNGEPLSTSKSQKFNSKSCFHTTAVDDLYGLYTVIHSVKNQLLWGHNQNTEENDIPKTACNNTSVKTHSRTASAVSISSMNSITSVSDQDTESSTETDSGTELDKPSSTFDYCKQTMDNFSWHLNELRRSLEELTEAAAYLTSRYENEVAGVV